LVQLYTTFKTLIINYLLYMLPHLWFTDNYSMIYYVETKYNSLYSRE